MNKLNDLSCPFTWKMERLCHTRDSLLNRNEGSSYDDSDEDDSGIPLLQLLYTVMKAYEYTESNLLEKAMKEIDESQDLIKQMQNRSIEKAVDHIIKASKCFILKRMNKTDDVKQILKTIPSCKNSSEFGALNGCQSAMWHFYKYDGNEEAVEHALIAIQRCNNGLWHFLLGKCLRRIRRQASLKTKPSQQEHMAFKTAFDMSNDPFIGIYLAQLYRERRSYILANTMYNTILDIKPNSCPIYLKLALGFIRCKEPAKARQCLDHVEARMPKNPRYLHYKGIYLDKCLKNYKEALECFETAGSLMNFPADLSYLVLKMHQTHGTYNPMPYLKNMLKRYEELGGYRVQVIFLNMGAYNTYVELDAKIACKYYLQAIEIDPRSKKLRNFYSDVSNSNCNVFEALDTLVIPKLRTEEKPDEETSKLIEKAEEYCKVYLTNNAKSVQQQMKTVTI